MKNIGIALFINTSLFLGGLHQWLYVKRILDRIFKEDIMVKKATVSISKLNPPIGGDVEMVTIKMSSKRKKLG